MKFLKFEVNFSTVLLYIKLICIYLYYHLCELAYRCFKLFFLKFPACPVIHVNLSQSFICRHGPFFPIITQCSNI